MGSTGADSGAVAASPQATQGASRCGTLDMPVISSNTKAQPEKIRLRLSMSFRVLVSSAVYAGFAQLAFHVVLDVHAHEFVA